MQRACLGALLGAALILGSGCSAGARSFAPRSAADGYQRVVAADYDDTLAPQLHPWRRGPFFPGAQALLSALDTWPDGQGAPGDVFVVTAREPLFGGMGAQVRRLGVAPEQVGYGRGLSQLAALFGEREPMIQDKLANLRRVLEARPGMGAVLFGDTVHADAEVYRRLEQEQPERVELILLHCVPGYPPPAFACGHSKMVLYRDYAEAARALHARGLLGAGAVAAVETEVSRARALRRMP